MNYDSSAVDLELIATLRCHDIAAERINLPGLTRKTFHPDSKKPVLAATNEEGKPIPVMLDTTNYDVQLIHVLNGGTTLKNVGTTFGSRKDVRFNLNLSLIVVLREPTLFRVIYEALASIQDIEVTDFSCDTLQVMQRELLFYPDPNKPYDPTTCVFAIRYLLKNADGYNY